MKLIFLLLTFVISNQLFSQVESDTNELYPYQGNILCLDEQTPFPEELQNVNEFEIIYFNRWGEILGKSADKNSYFQESLHGYKPSSDFEIVVYLIKYETHAGEKKELKGHMILSDHCNCG